MQPNQWNFESALHLPLHWKLLYGYQMYSWDTVLFQLKEIVERRHKEPIKFLFLPKMGLSGS